MEISDQQIEFIQRDLELRGITMNELNDSLVDHICCAIETHPHSNFQDSYLDVIHTFGAGKIPIIQKQTKLLLLTSNSIIMRKMFHIFGFLAAFSTSTGVLFMTMQWPGAGILLVIGVGLFNLGVLPMYFMDRYRNSVRN